MTKVCDPMKALIVSIIIFLLIIFLWFFLLNHMDQSLHELIAIIENNLEPAILQNNWEEAEEEFLLIKEIWHQHTSLYSFFIDEASLIEVSYSNARIHSYIKGKSSVLALSELSFVKEHLQALHQSELISIENIF